MIKGSHQTICTTDTATGKVTNAKIFHNRSRIAGSSSARLWLGSGVVRVATIRLAVTVGIFAKIGSMIVCGFFQLGEGTQFLQTCLYPPTIESF